MIFPQPNLDRIIRKYKIHILIFFLTLFIAITVAHPSLFVTDEWITVNQLSQLHDGHQILLNEGKYGTLENGTVLSPYFEHKQNYLAYPLFLPMISIPMLWIVESLNSFFVFGILYFWTFLIIIIALFLNAYFPSYVLTVRWRWTSGLIIAAFIVLFLNLLNYMPFPVSGTGSYPEIIAIVSTNIILFSVMAVIIYEIMLSVFADRGFAVLGTIISISSSSYLFWTNFCKDHILVALIFTLITWMAIYFIQTTKPRFLCWAFLLSGLLAWARPELAFLVCISLCFLYASQIRLFWRIALPTTNRILLFISPVFTFIGAIPFFINNYLFTKNIFIPAWIFWKAESSSNNLAINSTLTSSVPSISGDTSGTLIQLIISSTNIQPSTFLPDLYGILVNPQSGSIGVLLLVPLFFISLFALPAFCMTQKPVFSTDERKILYVLTLLSLGVFFAYLRGLSGMNASPGILPDIRYLSPLYLTLNIIGILILKKIPGLMNSPTEILKGIMISWIILIPLSLVAMLRYFPAPELWSDLYPPLNALFSIGILILIMCFLLGLLGTIFFNLPMDYTHYMIAFICAVPLIWQIDASFLARLFGTGLGGYSFWIPVVRIYFVGIF